MEEELEEEANHSESITVTRRSTSHFSTADKLSIGAK